jgi:predicted nucleotidyltransferase
MVTLGQIKDAVGQIAPNYKIREVKLFGSYASGVAQADSDVDLLVEYSEKPISVLQVFGFMDEVSEALGVEVDILKYPLENIIYPDFEVGETVDLYAN